MTIAQKNTIVLTVVIVVVAVMIYTGAYKSRRARGPESAVRGSLMGKPAPDFELETLDGKKVKLSDYRGKAVLLNFWATWCGPCKIEMPWFVEFQKQYRDQGFEILGVAMEETSTEKIRDFATGMGVNYTILRGKEAVGEAYGGVLGLPTTYYINREGIVVDEHAGIISRSDIETHIRKSMAPISGGAGR